MCFTQFNTKIYCNKSLATFIYFHTQLNSIHSIVTYKRVKVFEKGDSSNSQKMNGCSFQQVLRFLFQHRKKVFLKRFYFKATQKNIRSANKRN